MLDIALLIIAICMLLFTVAGIIAMFISLYMDKRKVYKVTYLYRWSNVPYELFEYVHATSIVYASRKIKYKDGIICSVEEVKDVQ